ncbi:hypothetical protein FGIG_00346 [Fasciola gigantica]|uniref:Uncharacterized protein n=1 Tax=Fasciola gigantica TaxID=46835 RepID=A0A504YBF1_FASGI|nr:hypothetical protein FGIG_00346 [Fasciola gigantica]
MSQFESNTEVTVIVGEVQVPRSPLIYLGIVAAFVVVISLILSTVWLAKRIAPFCCGRSRRGSMDED